MNEKDRRELVYWACKVIDVDPDDAVLDIDCEDGSLLDEYPWGVKTVGTDPDRAKIYSGHQNKKLFAGIVCEFCPRAVRHFAPFRVITVTKFDNYKSPEALLVDLKGLLHSRGVIILQTNKSICDLDTTARQARLFITGAQSGEYGRRLYLVHHNGELDSPRLYSNEKLGLQMQLEEFKLQDWKHEENSSRTAKGPSRCAEL